MSPAIHHASQEPARKCTIIAEPYYDSISGFMYAKGYDPHGSQYSINLSYLPPNVSISHIKQGQQWWIEKRTTTWTLMAYVGEFNPYSYALFTSSKTWVPNPSALSYSRVYYDQVVLSQPSTFGSIVSDPTTGYVSVPCPGIYDITASAQTTSVGKQNSTTAYYGSFYSTQNQSASVNTATSMSFNTTAESNGISIVNNTKITFANAGTYNIQFSAQFLNTDNSGSSSREVSIWLRKNGNTSSEDVPDSNGVFTVPNAHGNSGQYPGSYIAAWNYIVTVNAGDFYRLEWATTNPSITLAATTPTNGPESPSVILTVQQAGVLQGLAGQLGLQIYQPNSQTGIKLNGPWSAPSTGVASTDAFPISQAIATVELNDMLSFYVRAAWGGNAQVLIDETVKESTYLSVAYRGPILSS